MSPRKHSPRRQQALRLSPSKHSSEDAICLKLLILNQHIVQITLVNTNHSSGTSTNNNATTMETFRVKSAKLESSPIISSTIVDGEERAKNATPTVSLTIPLMDDLVSLAANLKPVQDLRFVLRETIARIRALTSRVDELAQLRSKYLTKITNPSKNKLHYGYGGEDQEVICSLSSQVTVVLRLTADCPILKGSAYIHRIVGVGGWDNAALQRIKSRVNEKRSRGPMDLMDTLVEEIVRYEKEDGMNIPKTPTLPMKRK